MNWPTFLAPAWGWLGLLAIPLIALYLLRQKRPDLKISSTLLWSKALADMRASTPFQKLRRNLLLILQLLILAALTLTLMRPVIQSQAGTSTAGVIVIDATASMQTTDGGGPSRLERAKDEAKKLVDTMRPGDRYMLISDAGELDHGGIGFSTSKSELRAEIDKIKPADMPGDLSESLILAATSLKSIGGANAGKDEGIIAGKVYLFSDGAGVKVPDTFGEGAKLLQFVKIGESNHSVGITRLSITPVEKENRTYQVFVGIKNAWDVEKKVGVVLAYGSKDNYLPGQAQFVTVPAHGQGGCVFEKVVADPGKLFVRVDDTDDDFPLDNTAYGVLEPARKVKLVLVTPGNPVLENFVKTAVKIGAVDGQIVSPESFKTLSQNGLDLVLLDGVVPNAAQMPKCDTVLIRPQVTGAGEVGGFKVSAEVENPAVLRWKREDPVMQYVELGDLHLSKALLMEKDPDAVELVSAPESALIAYKDFGGSGGVRRYFIAFSPLVESDWWRQPSLLIFLENVVEQTRVRHYIGMSQLLATGAAAKLSDVGDAAGNGPVKVTMPDGSIAQIKAEDFGAEFAATDKVGFYDVESNNKKSTFAANLLSTSESEITPASLQLSSGGNVEESTSIASVNKEIWKWLAVAGLAVLLGEWWVYHRRWA